MYSEQLKQQLNEVLEAIGFENWRQSRIAEHLLDDPDSFAESLDEDRYLLTGFYGGDFVYVYIYWADTYQPRAQKDEYERIKE